jgi:hypothetical protein
MIFYLQLTSFMEPNGTVNIREVLVVEPFIATYLTNQQENYGKLAIWRF